MDLTALQDQLRLRARRWGALLDGVSGAEVRRSPLRIKLLEDAWARFRAAPIPESPREARRALTEALRAAWLAGRAEARAGDDFGAVHLRRLARLEALESGLPGPALVAWDTVLTAAELRPSAVPDVGAALRHAASARADAVFRRRLQAVLAEAAAGDPGAWLRRQGVKDAAALVAEFPERVEESLIFIAPPAEAERRLRDSGLQVPRNNWGFASQDPTAAFGRGSPRLDVGLFERGEGVRAASRPTARETGQTPGRSPLRRSADPPPMIASLLRCRSYPAAC